MKVSEVVPGCRHVAAGGRSALFGAPPEALKFLKKAGLSIPRVGVLPDSSFVRGVSQIALEFPAYWFLFFDEERGADDRFRVIGRPETCERVREVLEITLFGPTPAQMKRWKLSRSRIDTLTRIMDYLAPRRDGRRLGLDDIFEFVPFPTEDPGWVPLFAGGVAEVRRLGDNRFAVRAERRGKGRVVDLSFEGEQLPLLAEIDDELELPQVLGVKLLGSYSGFDPAGPTTGMVLWVNCNGFLVDGPVGTSAYLRRLGIPKSDLCGVIVSHVHDDHCTLMDMILSEQRVNIITTREIYESMLIKVAGVLGVSVDQMRDYLTFTEVIPGKPVAMFGASWEFFYMAHSIPTIGFRVSVRGPNGEDNEIVWSGDTMHFAGLERMREASAISEAHERRLENLVRGGEKLAILDAGGPPIHGRASDYAESMRDNPDTEFLFAHVSPESLAGQDLQVAVPGWRRTLLPGEEMPRSLILKLLSTLRLLEVSDPAWINVLLSQGRLLEIPAATDVVSRGQAGDSFYFVLAGSLEVLDDRAGQSELLAALEGGDFFGEMSIIQGAERNATVRSTSRAALFRLPGDLFIEFVEANDLKHRFERIWLNRSLISDVHIFRNLHPHAKHEIGLLAERLSFERGDRVIRQGGKSDDFYIITSGNVEVRRREPGGETVLEKLGRGDFFGENVAMGYRDRRNASVVASSRRLSVLRLGGRDIRRIAASAPVLRHELHLVMRERGIEEIPISPLEMRAGF
ncbi:MAG: cyclic nucleotide-binding domain-containing protein [Polyangia bacterium]